MSHRSRSLPHLHIAFTVATMSVLLSSLLPAAPASVHAQTPSNLEEMKMTLYQQRLLANSSQPLNGKPFAQSLPSMMSISQPLITDQLDSSLAVFQSFRDGNWEIYRADNGGASVLRLTNNATSDITPRITLDGSKVVFVSNRDGNYEIYTMNPDGSNLRRLTNNTASDVDPAWSPDKSRIYFASNRSGNYDIWSMNADGSGQTAYAASSNPDLEPTVSPNGSVSWVVLSDPSTGIGLIRTVPVPGWISNPNSNLTTVGSCKYMARPNWSPDGMRLSYECDIDNDNWTELVVIDYKNPSLKTVIDLKEPFVDAQLNGWSPDDNRVIFTRVAYRQDGNQLAIVSATPMAVSAYSGQPAPLSFATTSDTSVDWKFIDSLPPTSKISVPPFTYANDPALPLWSAKDNGPAGIAFYFVDYSQDNGPWRPVVSYTTTTTGSLLFPSAQGVRFRVRAQDRAGNLEAAVDTGTSVGETILYLTAIQGTLTDNRNVPLPHTTLTISGNIPLSVSTGSDGGFLAQFTSSSSVQPVIRTLIVSRPGYAVMTVTNQVDGIPLGGILNYTSYLHAADDIVKNGRLDGNGSGWVSTGIVGFTSNDCLFLGGPAACMRPPQASISQKVTIPVTITKPTLSFISSWTIWSPPDATTESNLIVIVDDGLAQTAVFTSPKVYNSFPGSRANPQMNWIDMESWIGKTITLTFSIQTIGSGRVAGQAVIDDISLSSWLTPVPKQAVPARFASIAPGTTITITGENFIAPIQARAGNTPLQNVQRVDENTIVATLPSSLLFGRHDMYITNAGGQENVLPSAILIGAEAYAPIILR